MPNQINERDPSYYPVHMPDSHLLSLGHSTVRADLEGLEYRVFADKTAERLDEVKATLATKLPISEASLKDRALGGVGLGRDVMSRQEERQLNLELAALNRSGATNREQLRRHIDENEQYVDDMLEQTRAAFHRLDSKPTADTLDAAWAIYNSLSPYQHTLYYEATQSDPNTTIFQWLAEKKADSMPDGTPEEWRAKNLQADDDKHKLLNFLQSHNEYLAQQQQSPGFIEQVDEQKKVFASGIDWGLKEGWLHPDASKSLDRLPDFEVYIGDYFTTYFSHRGGFYLFGDTNQVCVADNDVEGVTVHELNHALLETFPDSYEKPLHQTWLFEAITEELAQNFQTGLFGEFDIEQGAYPEYRELLSTILEISDQLGAGVGFGDFTRAYSAPQADQDELTREIQQKYNDAGYPDMNIFSGIKDIMAQARAEIDANPSNDNLTNSHKDCLAAELTAGRLRNWAKTFPNAK